MARYLQAILDERCSCASYLVASRQPREAADSVLTMPQIIPVHAAERFEFAGQAAPMVRTPSTIQLLALFALEMEARGFEVRPDEQ